MKKGLIYCIICPIKNEIRYIGLTTTTIEKRFKKHIRDIDRSKSYKNNWLRTVRHSGLLDKLKIEVIEEVSIDILNERERYWIQYYNDLNFNLTNTTPGGEVGSLGHKHSDEAKRKISEASKNRSFVRTKEFRDKISKSLIGNKRRLGKTHTKQTKEKISNSKKGTKAHNIRTVYQYDKQFNFIRKWESATYIEKTLGFSAGNISSVCNGKRNYANNYIWSYERLEKNS